MSIIKSEYIRRKLSYIKSMVEDDTKQKLYNINTSAEYIFMQILNDVYGWNLINANEEKPNFPAIDLIDTVNETVFQVTSEISTKKVREDTIDKFNELVKQDEYKKYAHYKIKMFYIKNKPNFSDKILEEFRGKGVPKSHLYGIEDINSKVSTNPDIATKVFKTLCKLLHDKACDSDISPQLSIKLGKSTLIGREKELQEIDERLKASNTLLVKGIGGVGKSTIASNYLHRHKDEYDYYGFFEGLESFESELEGAFKLEIAQGQDRLDGVLRELIKLEPTTNKLLIIDNVKEIKDNQEKLEKILGLEHNGYRVLLTSRLKVKNVNIYPLPTLDPQDAQKLFLDNYRTNELEKVNKIIEYLDYHPLFIELVAKTIENEDYSLDDIIEKFKFGELAKIEFIDDDGDEISFNQNLKELFEMQKKSLKDEYLLLLKQLAILPSINIELHFLEEIFDRKLKSRLNFLVVQGWLIESVDGYKLHQVVKEFLLANYAPSLEEIETIVEYFSSHTNKGDIWIEFLESIAKVLEKLNFKSEKVLNLYFFTAKVSFDKYGDYESAKKYFLLNEKVWKEIKIDYDIENTYQLLARIFEKSEKLDDALTYINKALEIFIDKKEDQSVATCYDDKGSIYWINAKNNNDSQLSDKALYYFNKSLVIAKKMNNSHHMAIVFNNMSLIYRNKKDYSESHDFLQKALALKIDDKKAFAQFYNNRGELYTEEGKYELAEEDILLALKMREELYSEYELDENHEYFGESYDNLAIIHFKREKYKEAKVEQDKAIEIWSSNYNDNHSYLIDARERLLFIEKELQNE
ncbi:MAG: Unknown protein [uncultured Sulfurovum sp.]|uniref:SMEK domain-containing protein n=1 Tax=uncultured Sulfurovum sp. TaxID=269237 RepID=A0A6S6SZZ3_9BACT|nr:MAG: Unknown protein [uncultured Sulfurovum sp.]